MVSSSSRLTAPGSWLLRKPSGSSAAVSHERSPEEFAAPPALAPPRTPRTRTQSRFRSLRACWAAASRKRSLAPAAHQSVAPRPPAAILQIGTHRRALPPRAPPPDRNESSAESNTNRAHSKPPGPASLYRPPSTPPWPAQNAAAPPRTRPARELPAPSQSASHPEPAAQRGQNSVAQREPRELPQVSRPSEPHLLDKRARSNRCPPPLIADLQPSGRASEEYAASSRSAVHPLPLRGYYPKTNTPSAALHQALECRLCFLCPCARLSPPKCFAPLPLTARQFPFSSARSPAG